MVPMSSLQVLDPQSTAVLEAPLHMPNIRWTSADVAQFLGISQTSVSRIWRSTFTEVDDHVARTIRRRAGSLVGVAIDPSTCCFVLTAGRERPNAGVASGMRQARRVPLQVLLAADLARGTRNPKHDQGSAQFWQRLVDHGHDPGSLLVISREQVPGIPGAQLLVVDDAQRWQALLLDLVCAAVDSPMTTLRQLQVQLTAWATGTNRRFEWMAPADRDPAHGVPTRPTQVPRPLGQAMADEAFAVIVARITSGQLAGGDRITESSLQRALHTSRAQIREAMRVLALGGLVHLEPNRGALVPIPKLQDVIDTYDARLALGRLLIERAATNPRRSLNEAEAALQAMVGIAKTSDARATGDADLRFQDALVSGAGMPQVESMFRALSAQVLLYTAVLGLRYVYSIPDMRRDNVRILTHVKERNAEAAVEAWESKIEAARQFMAAHLP